MNLPKVPRQPSRPFALRAGDVIAFSDVLWRIHRTTGQHVAGWNTYRTYGPLPGMRFDPHPAGAPSEHGSIGVHYNATDIATAAAEVFQRTRTIDTTTGTPYLTGWQPVRPLELLDLTGQWPLRHGASAALAAAPRSTCRAWARAIHGDRATYNLDGIYVRSTMTGKPNIVLWNSRRATATVVPQFHRPLTSPVVYASLLAASRTIGYQLH